MKMERLIARVLFEGGCDAFKYSTYNLDFSIVKEITINVELENGEYCRAITTGKQIAEDIRQYNARLNHANLNRQMKMRPLNFWARLKYLLTGKLKEEGNVTS